jgi:superfamily II DNA helicase RecQ
LVYSNSVQVAVHNTKLQKPGTARHIIATVEQLFRTPEGHLPRLGILIRTKSFQKRIRSINIDEAHFIHTTGISRYGLSAFRPAWGELGDLKVLLPSSIPWRAMSATFPPHILKTVESKVLRPGYTFIQTTSNRPNTMYATHRVPSTIQDERNYECFLTSPFNFSTQPRVLIFFDNRILACAVSAHFNSLLPLELRDRGIVQFYHSLMSEEYLLKVHNDFTKPNGICKVLCSTSGESVVSFPISVHHSHLYDKTKGVDFPDVQIVCNAGVPGSIVDLLQRAGRLGRREGDRGLCVIFHEQWALDISLDEFKNGDWNDPDRPRTAILKPTSNVSDRVAYSCLAMVQEPKCLRRFFAQYLADFSPAGTLLSKLKKCLLIIIKSAQFPDGLLLRSPRQYQRRFGETRIRP